VKVTIEIAGPVVAKARARAKIQKLKSGQLVAQIYPEGDTVKYEAQIRYAGQIAMAEQHPGNPATAQPCSMTVDIYLALPTSEHKRVQAAMLLGHLRPMKKPDSDNVLKTAADGLNGIVYRDDKQIVEATVRKWWSLDPKLVITVETLSEPEAAMRAIQALEEAEKRDLFSFAGAEP
jgi:Holliday junction resolvase RusA-like endonuclease